MRRWVAGLAVALMMAPTACQRPLGVEGVAPTFGPVADNARMHQQAVEALARWDQAMAGVTGPVFLPVGDSFGQLGEWEPVNEGYKASLAAGLIVVDGDLPDSPSATAEVRWGDGSTATLPTVSAGGAVAQAPRMTSTCDGCDTLHITGAMLITDTAQSTRGPVTIPMWVYGLAGSSVRLTRPAVVEPAVGVTPPPWDSANPPSGLQIDSAVVSADGLTLTANFVGAKTIAQGGACGADDAGEAVESAYAVVVIIHQIDAPQPPGGHVTCVAIGYSRSATATFAKPLGERVVLEDREGLPVPVTRQG
jgi:hypothetical protein